MALGRNLGRVAIGLYLLAIHVSLAYLAIIYFYPDLQLVGSTPIPPLSDPIPATPAPTPLPVPSALVDQNVQAETSQPFAPDASPNALMIPVKGVKRSQLQDNFTLARGEGRTHNAIDIMAPLGTPVLAVADGEILKFFDSETGGVTIYQLSADKRLIFYYAHLQRRAENLKERDVVKRGTVIGYVGDTGNAGAGNFHLHFSIAEATDPKRFWGGPYINPYTLLVNGIETP